VSDDPLHRASPPNTNRSPLWDHVASGTQLAVSVLLGVYAGYYVDKHWGSSPWGLLLGAALGLAAGLYGFLKPFFTKK
jgi:F0F1-type ATP synthase assembly protein I